MPNLTYKEFYRRNLPHIQPEDAVFAVSFRLAFTLPQKTIRELKQRIAEYNRVTSKLKGKELQEYEMMFKRAYYENFDEFIGKFNSGRDWLKKREIALIVAESFNFWDEKRYDLHGFCIMPNHVHLIFRPLRDKNNKNYLIANILKSIKQHTALESNKILKRTGKFWNHESYDHFIRNEKDYNYKMDYLKNNPVKAGLVEKWEDWEFTYSKASCQLVP